MEEFVSTQDASFTVPPQHVAAALAALKAAPVDRLDLAGGFRTASLPEPGVPVTDQRPEFEALPEHLRAAATIRRVHGKGTAAGHEWDCATWPVFSVVDADRLAAAATLTDALDAWGWDSSVDADGGVSIENYAAASLYSDTEAALVLLAPYVEPGCYVHLRGDDGEWRWIVTADHVLAEQDGHVVFDELTDDDATPRTPACGCREINDYTAPDDDPHGPCEVCGHTPEEHGR